MADGDMYALDDYPKPKRQGKKKKKRSQQQGDILPQEVNPSDPTVGFSNINYEDDIQAESLGKLLVNVEKAGIELKTTHAKWLEVHDKVVQDRRKVHRNINKRKKQVFEMVEKFAEKLHQELDTMTDPQEEMCAKTISKMEDCLDQWDHFESQFRGGNSHMDDTLENKKYVYDLREKMEAVMPEHVLSWQPQRFKAPKDMTHLISPLFGNLQIRTHAEKKGMLMEKIEVLRTFSARTGKDQLSVGLTDIAILGENRILITDKPNKLLKMFNTNGHFLKVIGKGHLKDPCRVTVFKPILDILVTDNVLRCVKIFDFDGNFKGEFIKDLKFPSSLCINAKMEILVVEFETKTVAVYDQSGRQLLVFDTNMPCPAHIGVAPSGHIYITDWKCSTLKIFDSTGNCLSTYQGKDLDIPGLNEPQCVCVDHYGFVMVADKKNHRIQMFDEEGQYLHPLVRDSEVEFKLPVAVACTDSGTVVTGDYLGQIRILKYLDLDKSNEEELERENEDINIIQEIKRHENNRDSKGRLFNNFVDPDSVSLQHSNDHTTL